MIRRTPGFLRRTASMIRRSGVVWGATGVVWGTGFLRRTAVFVSATTNQAEQLPDLSPALSGNALLQVRLA